MAKLICVQLETCHANLSGSAWYAYYVGVPTEDELEECFSDESKVAPADLSWLGDEGAEVAEEVPTLLSKATGLRRYYVDGAC